MKRLRARLLNWLTVASSVLCVATLALWALCRNDLHQIIWFIGDTRYDLFSCRGNLGIEVLGNWPYHGVQPNWLPIEDNSAFIPILTLILLLALPLGLRLRQRWIGSATAESRTRTIIASDALLVAAGMAAFLWFAFYWLPENQTDDPAFFVAGSFGIALPVLLMWFAWRDIIRCFRKPHPAGFCLACGYDLRATPDRCPECGVIPKKKPIWPDDELRIGDEPGR